MPKPEFTVPAPNHEFDFSQVGIPEQGDDLVGVAHEDAVEREKNVLGKAVRRRPAAG